MKVLCQICTREMEEQDAAIIDQVGTDACTYTCRACAWEGVDESEES